MPGLCFNKGKAGVLKRFRRKGKKVTTNVVRLKGFRLKAEVKVKK